MAADARIQYAIEHTLLMLEMSGNITHAITSGMEELLDHALASGTCTSVLVDMQRAVYLDSTALGLLAFAARELSRQGGKGKVTLLGPSSDIRMLLESVGLDDVFVILHDGTEAESNLEDLPEIQQNECEKARMVLKAHRTLSELNDQNREAFRDVVTLLENELNRASQH